MLHIRSRRIARWILIAVISVICIIWLFPLFYIIMTSFRTDEAVMYDGYTLIPKPFTLKTYITVLTDSTAVPVARWFMNSLLAASMSSFLTVLVSSMAAYGYARMEFRGRDLIFSLLMFTMMIPGVVNLIPQYSIVSTLGMKNTIWALVLPGLAGVGNIFLIRQFLMGIPRSFDEAAKIDGAGDLTIFFMVLVPQMVPVLVVVALFSFLGNWNDLLWPLIIMTDTPKRTLTAGLSLLNGQYDREYASKMVATVVSALPVLIIYLFAQKFLLQGVNISAGIKE